MRGHGASGIGLRVVVSFHEKREPTFVSSPVGQQKVGLECRRRFRTTDRRVPPPRGPKNPPKAKTTTTVKKKRNVLPWKYKLSPNPLSQKPLTESNNYNNRNPPS